MDWLKRVDAKGNDGIEPESRDGCTGGCGSACTSRCTDSMDGGFGDDHPALAGADDVVVDEQFAAAEDRADDEDDDTPGTPVFTLATILDPSLDALTAARRMYSTCPTGLRFFSEDRRVERTRLGVPPLRPIVDEADVDGDAELDAELLADAGDEIEPGDELADSTTHGEY